MSPLDLCIVHVYQVRSRLVGFLGVIPKIFVFPSPEGNNADT